MFSAHNFQVQLQNEAQALVCMVSHLRWWFIVAVFILSVRVRLRDQGDSKAVLSEQVFQLRAAASQAEDLFEKQRATLENEVR